MVRTNPSNPNQVIVAKHWLRRIYIIEGVVASVLALGCVWVFTQVIAA